MGNREALLAGAKRCLQEKGYGRTTSRDIAAAAGVSLAAIGYHFRSTEALLNAALFDAMEDWGKEIARVAAEADPNAPVLERFDSIWTRMIESFAEHRHLWHASFEVYAQVDHVPEIRERVGDALQFGREGLAQLFHGIDPKADPKKAAAVGSLYQALLSGILVQWLVDPKRAPSGRDLTDALRFILADAARTTSAAPAKKSKPVRRGAKQR